MPGAQSHGPEQVGASTTAGTGPTRAPRSLLPALPVVAVLLGAAAIVLSTAAEGPPSVVPRSEAPPTAAPQRTGLFPSAPAPRPSGAAADPTVSVVLGTVLAVLAGLLALALAVVLVRLLVDALRRRPRRRPLPEPLPGSPMGAPPEATVDAPAVRRGIAAALEALTDLREPTDAVVRAWLGLQQSAEDAGVVRAPSETPTEFTRRVLSRSSADRAALGTLLALYLRARFGGDRITEPDARAAVAALRALDASWRTEPVGAEG